MGVKYWETTFEEPGWGRLRWYDGQEEERERVFIQEGTAIQHEVKDAKLIGNPHYERFLPAKLPPIREMIYKEMTEADWKEHFLKTRINFECRRFCTQNYSWAIPTPAVIEYIKAIHLKEPILEIGAGSGYFAALITHVFNHQRYVAYDAYTSHVFPWRYYDVQTVRPTPSPVQNLFLCWPNYSDYFAHKALLDYTPRRVLYIGEVDGCCAEPTFFEHLEEHYTEVEDTPEIDQYEGLHDVFQVWEKK
jgi:hypothetical protein